MLFATFDRALREAGYLPMGGQIVDATLVAAPRQRLTVTEKGAAKAGWSADEIWPDQPAKAAQKDVDARWTVKTGRRPLPEGAQRELPAIAIPVFGYKNHIAIDRAYGFIRRAAVSDAAQHNGAMLRRLVTSDNLAASVWADTAYRSQANEAWAGRHRPGVADPSQEAARAADAPAHRARQRPQVRRARPRGARVCPAEGAHGIARADDRPPTGADPHRSGQPGLQLSNASSSMNGEQPRPESAHTPESRPAGAAPTDQNPQTNPEEPHSTGFATQSRHRASIQPYLGGSQVGTSINYAW